MDTPAPHQEKTRNGKGQTTIDEERSPFVYRTLEVLQVAFNQLGVDLQRKLNINIRQLLMHVRLETSVSKQRGVIYLLNVRVVSMIMW